MPLTWGETSWLHEDTEERKEIDEVIEKTIHYIQSGGQFDVSLQVTIPNEWERIAATNIGYTAGIETHRTSAKWIDLGNQIDKIIVVSNHSKNVYQNTEYTYGTHEDPNAPDNKLKVLKLETDIHAVNYPTKVYENLEKIDLNLEYDFNFICMA